jgi:hypothetical protein
MLPPPPSQFKMILSTQSSVSETSGRTLRALLKRNISLCQRDLSARTRQRTRESVHSTLNCAGLTDTQCREKEKYLKHIYLTPSMKRNDGEENTVFKNSLFGDVCEKRLAATYNGTVLSEEDKSRFYEREIRPGTLLIPECGP